MFRTVFINDNGESGYLGVNGEIVERTPDKHPYSYDLYYTWGALPTQEDEPDVISVYSDRMYQWDSEKFNSCMRKHTGTESQLWNSISPAKLQNMFREYFDKPNLKLVRIFNGCNHGNGNPLYLVHYKEN